MRPSGASERYQLAVCAPRTMPLAHPALTPFSPTPTQTLPLHHTRSLLANWWSGSPGARATSRPPQSIAPRPW